MIDCLMCPRAHLFKDDRGDIHKIYCPFLAMKECIYGEHCIAGQAVIIRSVIRSSRLLIKRPVIPKFIPFLKRTAKYDWESLHEMIFTLWREGKARAEIAERVGVPEGSLYMYMRRYNE